MSEEKKPETPSAKDARSSKASDNNQSPSKADQPVDALRNPKTATGGPPKSTTSKKSGTGASGSRLVGFALLIILVIGGLSAVVWWQHSRFENVAREVADRLQQSDERLTAVEKQASEALGLARAQSQALEQATRRLSVVSNDLASLEQSWQSTTAGLDQQLLVNDLRRLLTMANQQLTLMGNVGSAISILESVRNMLESQDAPGMTELAQTVNTDLARLQALPLVDQTSVASKLDSLIVLSEKAPLLVPDRASPSVTEPQAKPGGEPSPPASEPESMASDLPWWQQLPEQAQRLASDASRVVVDEFAAMVDVRRANDPQALLLSEEQALALRANVRSMLLSAQLALLTRQSDIWRAELSEVESLLNTRYDLEAADTKAALILAQELLATPISVKLPTLIDSLSALESLDRAVSTPAAPEVN